MGKTYRKDPMDREYEAEDKMLEIYDKLASQWARKAEARKGKASV